MQRTMNMNFFTFGKFIKLCTMKSTFLLTFFMAVGFTCLSQDFIKPHRFDTVYCSIVADDSVWLYYLLPEATHQRKYRKSDISYYSFQGKFTDFREQPDSGDAAFKASILAAQKNNPPVPAQPVNKKALRLKAISVSMALAGSAVMTTGLFTLRIFSEPSYLIGGFTLVAGSYLLDIAAELNKNKSDTPTSSSR